MIGHRNQSARTLRSKRGQRSRLFAAGVQRLETRLALAYDFLNDFHPCDVDDDGYLAPIDALVVINELSAEGPRDLPDSPSRPQYFLDVDGDNSLSPTDALTIVNELNISPGENPPVLNIVASLAPESDPDGNGVVLSPDVNLTGQTLPNAWVRVSTVNDQEWVVQTGADGRFELSLALDAGLNELIVEATDRYRPTVNVVRTVRLGDVAVNWNASLLNVIRDWTTLSNDPYPNRIVTERPPMAVRNLAMVHAAMFDAVNSIEGAYEPYLVEIAAPSGASSIAAAAAAAHRVASALYSADDERAVFDAALAESLAMVPAGAARDDGLEVGRQVADAMLAARNNDGAKASVPYTPGADPGDWQRTFPDYLPPLLPQWPQVTPFAIESGSQFRPAAPPALDSAEYAAAVDEVMQLGRVNNSTRTDEQTAIALFWADGGGTATPPGHWNQIAIDVGLARGTSFQENVRNMALLNIAMADAGIAAWDAKYAYDLWRPIDAIRKADTDGNDATSPDATWTPLLKTPPFPTYTSGHSTFSGAADAVLTHLFGSNVAFTSQPDGHTGFSQKPLAADEIITRSFTSFSQAADEAGRSRIYGGIHFEFDNSAGLASGRSIGQYVVDRMLLP